MTAPAGPYLIMQTGAEGREPGTAREDEFPGLRGLSP
jgi:hypothetical protein